MPDMSLFASRLNKQLNKFVLWNYNPESYQVDKFSVYFCPYTSQPIKMIGRVINNMFDGYVTLAIIIITLW